jgi:hypothetical protein
MINEHGAVRAIKMVGENDAVGEYQHQCHFLHHTFHSVQPGMKSRLLQWEAGD